MISVKEGISKEEPEKEQIPYSLASGLDGEIVRMITRAGTSLVKTGDMCEKGSSWCKDRWSL